MALKLLFFAQCSEWTDTKEMAVPLPKKQKLLEVIGQHEVLKPILDHRDYLRVAINCEYTDFSAEVQDGDEVAFMPPFSGG